MKKQLACGLLLSLFSTVVLAHPDHGLTSAYAGFIHPFLGWDHLLMMIGVGVWAARLAGALRWQLPTAFVSFMAVGAGLGSLGFHITGLETAIATSVIAMGGLLAINLPMPVIGRVGMIAAFAVLHGMAHGVELGSVDLQSAVSHRYSILCGMLLATSLLHGFGYIVGAQRSLVMQWLSSGLAYVMLAVGGLLLFV